MEKELRKKLDYMPHDRNGMKATGFSVCKGDKNEPSDWWDEFVDSDGIYWYFR